MALAKVLRVTQEGNAEKVNPNGLMAVPPSGLTTYILYDDAALAPIWHLSSVELIKDTDDASKFVVVGTPLTDSPYVMNFKIVLKI